MSYIARLGVLLGLNSAEFTKGLDEAVKKTKDFERNQKQAFRDAQKASEEMSATFTAAAGAAGALAIGFAAIAKAADDIVDVSKAFDMTIESILATKSALQAAGGEADNLTNLMSKLASIQEDAKNGSDAMRESFAKLNISGKDVDNLKLDELFRRVAVELSKIEDAGKRAAVAQDLLGKAAKGVNWADFVNEYKEFANVDLANAIRENAKAWDNIEKSMKGISMLVQQLIQPFAIVFNYAFDLLNIWKEIKEGGDVSVDWGAAMGGAPGEEGGTTTHQGAGKKRPNAPIIRTPMKGGYSQASEKEKAAAKKAADDAARLEERMIALIEKQQERLYKFRGEMQALQTVQDRKVESYWQEYYVSIDLMNLESQRYKMTENEYNNQKMLLEQKQRIIDIEKKATDAQSQARAEMERASSDDVEYARKLYEEKVKNIQELKNLELGAANELNAMERQIFEDSVDRQYSWIEGWKAAFRSYTEASDKAFNQGQQAFSIVIGNMDAALRNFVQTGKLNFKDFAESIVKEMLYMEMKAQAMSFIRGIFGAIGASVSVGPLGGGKSMESFGAQQYPRRASGGSVFGPTLIGENGPELFIPSTPGTVIPNGSWQQMAAMGSGSGFVNNGTYIASMSAIDTQSATQFLASNKQTIWAAYQSANRSVPISR